MKRIVTYKFFIASFKNKNKRPKAKQNKKRHIYKGKWSSPIESFNHQKGWSSGLGVNARVQCYLRSYVQTPMGGMWEFPPLAIPMVLAF